LLSGVPTGRPCCGTASPDGRYEEECRRPRAVDGTGHGRHRARRSCCAQGQAFSWSLRVMLLASNGPRSTHGSATGGAGPHWSTIYELLSMTSASGKLQRRPLALSLGIACVVDLIEWGRVSENRCSLRRHRRRALGRVPQPLRPSCRLGRPSERRGRTGRGPEPQCATQVPRTSWVPLSLSHPVAAQGGHPPAPSTERSTQPALSHLVVASARWRASQSCALSSR